MERVSLERKFQKMNDASCKRQENKFLLENLELVELMNSTHPKIIYKSNDKKRNKMATLWRW